MRRLSIEAAVPTTMVASPAATAAAPVKTETAAAALPTRKPRPPAALPRDASLRRNTLASVGSSSSRVDSQVAATVAAPKPMPTPPTRTVSLSTYSVPLAGAGQQQQQQQQPAEWIVNAPYRAAASVRAQRAAAAAAANAGGENDYLAWQIGGLQRNPVYQRVGSAVADDLPPPPPPPRLSLTSKTRA